MNSNLHVTKRDGRTEPLDAWEHLAFRLDINEWKGERKVQFLVEGALQS